MEEEGGNALSVPVEQHGGRRTRAKLEGIVEVISSRLVDASSVSFALFSAVKARKLQAPIFAR